ncbi:MAG TPA: hypothetical protein VGN76_03960 [Gemmatimonadales bacterium]|nr:hypothetical protein [Gemmatimonadales bacterium]
MRKLYFTAVTTALCVVLALPGRLSAQAAANAQAVTPAQTVTCKDGTSSHKAQGACSHHGGVVHMVTCKDGTTSKEGQGACSHHGGVVTKTASSAKANSNQTKSGVTNTSTGQSTMDKGGTKTSPDQGPPVPAKGDTNSPR